jgi:RNA polymerase sigma-70 factor (ECF subfamily)
MRADNPADAPLSPLSLDPEDLRAHTIWLRRLATSLVGPGALAEDVAQDTWTTACAQPPVQAAARRSWLRTVMKNRVRAWARADRSRGRREAAATELTEPALPSSEELLVRHEALTFVAQEVRRLKEPYRSTVLLCYAEDVPPGEIARRQGLPAGTVRWRLKQGLDELRRRFEQRYGRDRRAWSVVLGLTPTAVTVGSAAAPVTVKAAVGTALALLMAVSFVLSFWLSTPADPAGQGLAPPPPARNAKLADAGSPPDDPSWSRPGAPLLVQNRLSDENEPGSRDQRM